MVDQDLENLQRAVEGDADALAALLERFGPHVRVQLSIDRKWNSILDAEDVMQVTYLEAFLRIRRFQPNGVGSFIAWLTRIAENNLRDALKELGRQKRPQPEQRVVPASYADSVVNLTALLGITTSTPSRAVSREEHCSLLEQALLALPPDYAAVVRLYDLQGQSIQDVAAELKRSTGAVHMLRQRAHELLRELMGPDSNFFSRGA